MDYRLKIIFIQVTFLLTLVIRSSHSYGYDSATSCNPKASRHGRAELIATIPCDLTQQGYCNLPGSSYPWHAVRRFVHENQGLMKRMYGDVRHISILRNEIQNNNIDVEDIEMAAARYSRDGFRKKKYLHPDNHQNPKFNDVLSKPHFRPTTSSTTTTTTKKTILVNRTNTTPTTKSPTVATRTTIKITSVNPVHLNSTTENTTTSSAVNFKTYSTSFRPIDKNLFKNKLDGSEDILLESPDNNLESNIIVESSTANMENIKVVQAPNLASNRTESATISTTLKVVQQIIQSEIESEKSNPKEPILKPDADVIVQIEDRIDENISLEDYEDNISNTAAEKSVPVKDKIKINEEKLNTATKEEMKLVTMEKFAEKKKNNRPNTIESQLFQDTIEKESPTLHNIRGVNACPVKEEVVAPFWANNTRGEVLALLNLYPFEQYVHWEKCTHEHKQMYCRDGCRCEQQFRLHRLLAYDPHNECRGIFSDWFRFPSCCICKCYDIPPDFRVTSRSPRTSSMDVNAASTNYDSINIDDENDDDIDLEQILEDSHPIDEAEMQVQKAIYEHATEEWYHRPQNERNFHKSSKN